MRFNNKKIQVKKWRKGYSRGPLIADGKATMLEEKQLKFIKMQGAGNDYVYVDCFREPFLADPSVVAPKISDRHFGVGGDGLVLVQPSELAASRMRMFNADGSESEMCGNGVRCVAHLTVARGYAPEGEVSIETGRGVLTVCVQRKGHRKSTVQVAMGTPILNAENIPVEISSTVDKQVIDFPCKVFEQQDSPWFDEAKLDHRMTCVSMGNPHAVFYCHDVMAIPLETVGPLLECHPMFPKRMNVHFVQRLTSGRVRMRTWERGSGITMACGTGASAVCVAGVLTGRTDSQLVAELPGGELVLQWDGKGEVFMTGPAEEVFEGEWYLEHQK